MKRLVSIILATILLMSLAVIPVFAESSGLINEYLQEKLDAIGDDDKISVWIWIYSAIDMYAIEHQALVETGLVGEELDTIDEIDAYRKARTRLIAEFYEAENQAVLDKIGVAEEDIIFLSSLTQSFIINITKSKVYEVAQMQEIASIDYYEEAVFEEPTEGPDDKYEPELPKLGKYKDVFVEKYGEPIFYSEFYSYPEESSIKQWVLVQAAASRVMVDPGQDPTRMFIVNGDLVFNAHILYDPFKTSFAVYDVSKGEFYDLTEVDYDEYEGLAEQVASLGIADIVGDLDGDKNITVFDATKIQLILAKIEDLKNFYVADYNRDNDLDVMDATAIQRKLAKLDEDASAAIVKQEKAFNYSNLADKPADANAIEHELLYTYEDFTKYPSTYFENYYEDIYAIVKSKAQYDELLNIHNDKFNEEFFNTNWLVITVRRTSNLGILAPAKNLSVKGDTLYFTADEYAPDVPVQPVESFFTSIVSVDKALLKDVTDIARVKENNDLVIKEEKAYSRDQFPEIPYGAKRIEYRTLYYYEDYTTVPGKYYDTNYNNFYAIIKSKSQYDEVMNVYNDKFDEAFFEDKYLVVSAGHSTTLGRQSSAYNLCVSGNTLYFNADLVYGGVNPMPIEHYFASVIAVDKELLKGVTDIARAK